MVKNPPANAGDIRDECSTPGLGRSPGGGHGNPLQYSCLENPMDRGAWRVTWGRVHGVTKGQTQLNRLSMHACVLFFPVLSPLGCTVGVTAGTGSPFASILSPLRAHHRAQLFTSTAGNSFHSPQLDVHLGPFTLCGLGTTSLWSTGHRGPLRVGERPEVYLFSHWPRLPLEGDPPTGTVGSASQDLGTEL